MKRDWSLGDERLACSVPGPVPPWGVVRLGSPCLALSLWPGEAFPGLVHLSRLLSSQPEMPSRCCHGNAGVRSGSPRLCFDNSKYIAVSVSLCGGRGSTPIGARDWAGTISEPACQGSQGKRCSESITYQGQEARELKTEQSVLTPK